jgi:hypothetical protein
MARAVLAVAVSAWLVSACVPVHVTLRKSRTGRVLDARSGKPVIGATVRAESFNVPTPPGPGSGGTLVRSLEVKTDADGRWELPSDSKWTTGILAADGFPLYVEVHCVFADGYEPVFRNPNQAWFEPAVAPGHSTASAHEIETEVRLQPSTDARAVTPTPARTRCDVPVLGK